MKIPQRFKALLGLVGLLIFLPTIFAIPYFVTGWLYGALRIEPYPLVSQIINSILGLFLGIWVASLVAQLFQPERGAFAPIIEALESIARGNFQVRVENMHRDNGLIQELTDSINKMAVELNEMEQMRQGFISDVSHELQSPLTSIRGFARALQNDALSASERHHYLNIIEIESTRLSSITDNLLRLACLQAERVILNPQPYRLDRQIRELVLACEPQWSAKSLEMEVELAEVPITADREMLSQVWSNLVQNAIKFTPTGGTIAITLAVQGNDVCFTIRDTGIGIAKVDQPHIFERFYKADKARERSIEGSGLGLAIAEKSVALHGGTIAVASVLGEGANFTVRLPLETTP